jgi:hypothetical protein
MSRQTPRVAVIPPEEARRAAARGADAVLVGPRADTLDLRKDQR